VWLAAAAVAAIVSAVVLTRGVSVNGVAELPPVVINMAEDTTTPSTTATPPADPVRSPSRAELVVGGGVADLADADLEALLAMLEGLDAQIDVEPVAAPLLLEGEV
jgi:hypothetical protein